MKITPSMEEQLKSFLEPLFNGFTSENVDLVDIVKRGYVGCTPEPDKRLWMYGINPSFLNGDKNGSHFYPRQGALEGYGSHYASFERMAKEGDFKNQWSYADLLFLRETEQKKLFDFLGDAKGLQFISDQLKISQNLLEAYQPKVILVANGLARKFFGKDIKQVQGKQENVWMGYTFEFDERFGVDVITGVNPESVSGPFTTNLLGVPVLFTGTFTYMDLSNKARLAWQLRQVNWHYEAYFGDAYFTRNGMEQILDKLDMLTKSSFTANEKKVQLAASGNYEQAVMLFERQKKMLDEMCRLVVELKTLANP